MQMELHRVTLAASLPLISWWPAGANSWLNLSQFNLGSILMMRTCCVVPSTIEQLKLAMDCTAMFDELCGQSNQPSKKQRLGNLEAIQNCLEKTFFLNCRSLIGLRFWVLKLRPIPSEKFLRFYQIPCYSHLDSRHWLVTSFFSFQSHPTWCQSNSKADFSSWAQ